MAAAVTAISLAMGLSVLAQTPQAKPPATSAKKPATPAPKKKKAGPTIFVSGDGGYQTLSTGFTAQLTFPLYAETATFTATATDVGGAAVGLRGGYRLHKNFFVGAGVTGFWSTRPADVEASLPHPFFFGRPRSVEGSTSGLKRNETMAAIEASYLVKLSKRMDMQLFAGPAFFKVKADIPTSVNFTEVYPYDTATFSTLQTSNLSDSAIGVTVGADVAYMFNRSVGVGGHVRYSRASASLSPASGQETTIDLGGLQAGVGLRFRF
jgi:opacity protein-like surface antigen